MTLAEFARVVFLRLDWAILFYFLVVNLFYGVLLVAAAFEMRSHNRKVWGESRWRILGSELTPLLSILVPAYNEEATVAQSVRGLLTLRYPNLEVVVVNDGSADRTLEVLIEEFQMVPVHPIYRKQLDSDEVRGIYRSYFEPGLVVVDKVNGGKADALNAALNIASGELVCSIDADTLIEPDALLRIVRPFLLGRDVAAAGGTIRVANASTIRGGRLVESTVSTKPIVGFQIAEYLRGFLFGRLGWNRLGGNLIISGAFGLFHRKSAIAAGGYLRGTVGEDMELVARLRRRSYDEGGPSRIEFIPDPVAWTEVPESLRVLGRQRDRWHRGLADVLWRYKGLLLNPRYRALGWVVYPYFFFVELLAPVIELLGLLGLGVGLLIGAVNLEFALLFLLVAYGLGAVFTLYTLVVEEFAYHQYDSIRDRVKLVIWVFFENLGYRQMTVLWRLRGIVRFLRKRTDWGAMTRTGFQQAAASGGPEKTES
ncbi:MAG: glycosyltransferase family 2 protein [Actinomycetota bacterium]